MDSEETKKDAEEIEFVEEGSGDEARDKIKKLKEELGECRKKAEEYLAGWQRAKADFINSRKDEEKEREAVVKFANKKLLYELLNVKDSMEMALKQAEEIDKAFAGGLNQILNLLSQITRGCGVRETETLGQKFNPEEQESVAEEEVAEAEKDQIVLEVVQKGYKIHDRVLRPAKVKVGIFKQT